MVREELQAVAEEFGDDRRSPIVAREDAQAISEEKMLPTEPITVILSKGGWVRAAKGHEVDVEGLNFSFRGYLFKFCARQNEPTSHLFRFYWPQLFFSRTYLTFCSWPR